MKRNRNDERGVALILTMILLVVMSVMAISLAFVSKTETWSSMNYRLMSQARDAAESGVNSTANYLMNTYTPPTGTGATFNTFAGYNAAVWPVQSGTNTTNHDIILSASSVASNYPDSTVQSAFNSTGNGKGSFTAGNAPVTYATSARLLSMQGLVAFGSTTPTTLQTWEITSAGSIAGIQSAQEQVTAVLERSAVPTFFYAAFATDNGCNALQFGGGGTTDSYADGGSMTSGANSHPVTSADTGNVGTNGNLDTVGNPTTINGTLSTPRTGVGTCSAGSVTAWTNASGHVTGPAGCGGAVGCALVELPQTVSYPTPTIPAPGTNALSSNGSCGSITGCTTGVAGSPASSYPAAIHLLPTAGTQLSDVTLTGNADLYLSAGTYDFNTLKESGNTVLHLEDATSCATLSTPALRAACVPVDSSHPVVINITGTGGGTVVDLTGGGITNPSSTFDPTTFSILYAGTGTVKLKGGATATGLLYAPNATFSFGGGGDWYGAVIGKDMTDMGGTAIHYDRKLKDEAYTIGPYMLSSFTWNKY